MLIDHFQPCEKEGYHGPIMGVFVEPIMSRIMSRESPAYDGPCGRRGGSQLVTRHQQIAATEMVSDEPLMSH